MKTELSEVLPFQSLFGWFMLLPGGRTKDLVRKIYFGILSITLVLKFKQSTKYFCKSKQHFLYAVYTKSFVLVEPVIATRNPAKIVKRSTTAIASIAPRNPAKNAKRSMTAIAALSFLVPWPHYSSRPKLFGSHGPSKA